METEWNPQPGEVVTIINAFGEESPRVAVSNVLERGHDFPVVFVCREDEWLAAQEEDREPDTVPWPAEDVRPAVVTA